MNTTTTSASIAADADGEDHFAPSVRLIEVERADSATCGFHLTRGKWDPYPWVSKIDAGSLAADAGLRPGDCVLEVNGEDVVGKRISEVAHIVKSQPQVSLLLWNAGANVQCSPDTLCCGPMPNNFQRLSACMSSILSSLECPICLDTSQPPIYQCDNGHIICMRCRAKSERCPVCRVRLTCGRSLFADNVYNAIMDAFELRKVTPEGRTVKMNQIFKMKDKGRSQLPDIKVSHAHANKFLARIVGKASSVENLSTKSPRSHLLVDSEFNGTLKAKSLSSSEIFNPTSPNISRASSSTGIAQYNCTRCSSFDSLTVDNPADDGVLYFCPFSPDCTILFKDIYQHFESYHDGPLIQYFKPKVTITLSENHSTYFIRYAGKYFILKITQEQNDSVNQFKDLRIWIWIFGSKKLAADYQIHINLHNTDASSGNTILSTQSLTYSLNTVSWVEIRESKKAVFLNAVTLKAINAQDILIDVEIFKCEANYH